MIPDRKEQLYTMLSDVLHELTEYDTSEVIFDYIVVDFAAMVEYHSSQTDVFTEMLNTFRHDNPVDTIPDEPSFEGNPSLEELLGGVSDINRQYMLEDRDNLLDFLKSAHFPDKLDS